MNYSLYKHENYATSQWMGGKTTELAIYPKTSKYLDRNFIWRLSSATIEVEESDFSKLPDYDRVLMVLEGEVVLSHEGQRVAKLKELEQDRFDGGWKTKSFGKITDYNLMVRKGCEGYLDVITLTSENKEHSATEKSEMPLETHALYCKDGYFVISVGGQSQMLKAGELYVIEGEKGEKLRYSLMGEGTVIRAQIFQEGMEGEVGPESIPEEKATFDDFKQCIFLANTQFRGAKYIVKKLKETWYDEALSAGIKTVEKFYLTSLVFVLGVLGLGIFAVNSGLSVGITVAIMATWFLVDCLIISPLIYMPFMPKPIRKHIKDINNLTPYEQRVRTAELGTNEAVEKVLKKYKNTGKNLGKTE